MWDGLTAMSVQSNGRTLLFRSIRNRTSINNSALPSVFYSEMKKLPWIIAAAAFAVFGCHKNPETPAQPTPAVAADPAAPPAPPPEVEPTAPPPKSVAAVADNIVQENVNGRVDAFLTSQLRTFIQQYNRMPKSFAEFALRRVDSMPRPPDGQKWVIDSTTQEVKSIPK